MRDSKFALVFILTLGFLKNIGGIPILKAPQSIEDSVQLSPKYSMKWTINEGSETIRFILTVETHGFVGFGLSPTGGMESADMIIAGIDSNGATYFSDRHGLKTNTLVDEHEDWTLEDIKETEHHTIVTVSRLLNTCDDEDIPITLDTAKLIWSFGDSDSDVIGYHGRDNRGTKSVNLLVPQKKEDMSGYETWDIKVNTKMPIKDTTYWCTFHRSPPRTENVTKLHIVGWDVMPLTDLAAKYTHHVDLKRCITPAGKKPEEVFGPFVGKEGADCYEDPGDYPIHYCESYVLTWAVGRGLTLLPEHVGYSVAETQEDEFYILEVHYDNPTHDEVPAFETGLQIYYTETPRPTDADLIGIGHFTIFTMAVPPDTDDFVISGHCPSQCTELFPAEGITVFSGLLHAHISGRRLKLRHFRDGKELPWVSMDNNFDFNFQENKPIERVLLPGDSFTYECTYSSKWKNGSAVTAGLGSREEMCLSWLWYFPKINMNFCYSYYPLDKTMEEFGIKNLTGGDHPFSPPAVIWEPESMYNKSFQTVLDTMIDWTPERISKMQQDHRYGDHEYFCYSVIDDGVLVEGKDANYPKIDSAYVPEDICKDGEPDPDPEEENTTKLSNFGTKLTTSAIPLIFVIFGVMLF